MASAGFRKRLERLERLARVGQPDAGLEDVGRDAHWAWFSAVLQNVSTGGPSPAEPPESVAWRARNAEPPMSEFEAAQWRAEVIAELKRISGEAP